MSSQDKPSRPVATEAGALTDGAVLSRLGTWAKTYGAALCPGSRPDTFGEGMREAKEQVSLILASAAEAAAWEQRIALRASRPVATEAGESAEDAYARGLADGRAIASYGRPVATEAGATRFCQRDAECEREPGHSGKCVGPSDVSRPVATEAGAKWCTHNVVIGGNDCRYCPACGEDDPAVSVASTRKDEEKRSVSPIQSTGLGPASDGDSDARPDQPEVAGSLSCPPLACSKARAEGIANRVVETYIAHGEVVSELGGFVVDALDRAKFFADEAVLAEIGRLASRVDETDRTNGNQGGPWRPLALALASAVRKLGIGGER